MPSPSRCLLASICLAIFTPLASQTHALTFEIDYRYDTENFFNAEGNPQGAAGAAKARLTIQAAAARFGAIIDQKLLPAEFADDRDDPRIRFLHPGNGKPIEVSSAASRATDALLPGGAAPAAEYRGPWSIPADTYVLYIGAFKFGDGNSGNAEAIGNSSTGFGENFNEIIDNPDSPINRGFPHPFRSGPRDNLPVWGGSIAFTNHSDVDWHFDHTTLAGSDSVDFYSVVLHEIAHVLGINTREWNNWRGHIQGINYTGPQGIAALRADNNGTANPEIISGLDPHWFGQTALSKIFPAASPNYPGTVGSQTNQLSLMYGTLPFSFPDVVRLEITNLDAACLRDTGWSTISGEVPDNRPPEASNTTASVPEDTPVGDVIAAVIATDPDPGDTLSYAITSGNTGSAFAIDTVGNITVAAPLNDEQTASYTLTVTITDPGSLTATAAVTITITNVPSPVGTDITDFNITSSSDPGAIPSLSWTAPPGTRFTIMTSTNLRDWLAVTPDLIAAEEITTWQDGQEGYQDPNPPASQAKQKYYRLMIRSEQRR